MEAIILSEITKEIAYKLQKSRKIVALTGAGISVESGIPAFRGSQGLWDRYDPMEFAHIESFLANPGKVWRMLVDLGDMVAQARPNSGHLALAQLESMGHLRAVITQNIDGLHQAAGNKNVIEFHGNGQRLVCLSCRKTYAPEVVNPMDLPPRCSCRGILKPDVVFFGEPIPVEATQKAFREARSCDMMLVVGTSAVVAPASNIPFMAKQQGAVIVEINLEKTHLSETISDYVLEASAGHALSTILGFMRSPF
jgi:NAD-dependent deacetylase